MTEAKQIDWADVCDLEDVTAVLLVDHCWHDVHGGTLRRNAPFWMFDTPVQNKNGDCYTDGTEPHLMIVGEILGMRTAYTLETQW